MKTVSKLKNISEIHSLAHCMRIHPLFSMSFSFISNWHCFALLWNVKRKKKEKKEWKKYRRQIIFGAGNPSARHVILMFWFSRTATDDGVLSISKIFGGTAITNAFHYTESKMSINGIHSNDLNRTIIYKRKNIYLNEKNKTTAQTFTPIHQHSKHTCTEGGAISFKWIESSTESAQMEWKYRWIWLYLTESKIE